MPWPKKYTWGCCVFCKQEYRIQHWAQGFSWHKGCPSADAARKRIKNAHNRAWHQAQQAKKGHIVIPRSERVAKRKTPPAELRQRGAFTGVKIKSPRHICQRCGAWTINRFNCKSCLSRIGDIFDLSIAVEPGYSRHIGAFAGE